MDAKAFSLTKLDSLRYCPKTVVFALIYMYYTGLLMLACKNNQFILKN